jgi:hypothetical protein
MRANGWLGIGSACALLFTLGGCGHDSRDEQAQAGLPSVPGMDSGKADDDADGATDAEDPFDEERFDVADGEPPSVDACVTDPDVDDDGDGFTENEGDCNDCDPNVNPAAIEVVMTEPDENGEVPEPADEDCDGIVDNVMPPCDGAIPLNDGDPMNAARALGLCKEWSEDSPWGITKVEYVRADGTPAVSSTQNGIMWGFGDNVSTQEGSQLLALSTGRARVPGQPDACNSMTCEVGTEGTAPFGFPQDVPECPGATSIYDDVALELTIVAPSNAHGFAFDFNFFSFEYPQWICTAYNDQFIALVDPPPEGSINGNISFDSQTNPVSVNIAFFEVCDGCPLGTAELQGTGFGTWDSAGGTSWLQTTSPVAGGTEFKIRFLIWDTGDQRFDSTVLLDNFHWIAEGGTVTVDTAPVG